MYKTRKERAIDYLKRRYKYCCIKWPRTRDAVSEKTYITRNLPHVLKYDSWEEWNGDLSLS